MSLPKTRRFFLLLLPALLLAFGLAAGPLASSAKAQLLRARLYDEDSGLGSLTITALAQDPRGYLWIGTQNGLFRYGGSSFEEFGRGEGFNEPAIYSLLVDRLGTVWAGTHTGLFRFDGQGFVEVLYRGRSLRIGMNSMLTATASGELIAQEDDRTFSVEQIRPDSGRPEWQALRYEERHPGFPRLPEANGVGVDSSGHLWIGCEEGLCEFAGGTSRQTLGPADGVPKDYYMSLFQARDGQMWARGRKHLLTWRPGDRRVRDLSPLFPEGGMHTVYRRYTEDSTGKILTPTALGFATWDGTRWTETRATAQGPIHGATEVFFDREGAVWIGTEGRGLLQTLGYGRWSNYGAEAGLNSENVAVIGEDRRGSLWFGNNLALNRLAPGSSRMGPSALAQSDGSILVQALAPDATGGMWIGSLLGHLSHVNAKGSVDIRASMDPYIYDLLLAHDGTLWMATNAGLYQARCVPGASCTPVRFELGEIGTKAVRDLAPDGSGGFWAVGDHGLDHLENGGILHIKVAGQKQNFNQVESAGPGRVWLAGEAAGFLCVRVEDAQAVVEETHRRPELLSDRVQFLATDATGRLWIGTDHGVNVLEHGRMMGLTTEDGLSSNDTNTFFAAADGTVWIGTTGGASRLLNPDAVLHRQPFAAEVDQVVREDAGERVLIPAVRYGALNLPWKAGVTSIRFSAPTLRDNHALLYHYRLYGLNSGATTTRTPVASFGKLAPGSYTFEVVAEDPVHHLFSAPSTLSFRLQPPWYRSAWMHVLMVLGSVGLVNLAWRSSYALLLVQRRRLARMVEERTREIEQMALHDSLTGVLNRRAIMARLEEEVEYARRHGTALCIALVDLDHFKSINDTLGHLAGDAVLREAARRLGLTIRASDAIGRYGGEEFILLFRNVDPDFSLEHCERVRLGLCEEPIDFEGAPLSITCSIGLAWTRNESEVTPALVARADKAMYLAKKKGRNRVEWFFAEEQPATVLAMQ